MNMKKLMEMEEKVTIDSHCRGSERSHSIGKKYSKENGIRKKMNEEECDREITEIRIHLDLLMELLQRSDEDQRCGWTMRKKVKWHRLQVKWEHRLYGQLKEELLREAEYHEDVMVCELEHEPFLGEDDNDTKEEHVESFIHCLEDQHENFMAGPSGEAEETIDFKSNNWCVNAGYVGLDDGEFPHEGNNIEIPINGIVDGNLVREGRNLEFEEDHEPNGCSMDEEELMMIFLRRYCILEVNDWCMH
jgi:hypothetical protein